MNSLQDEYEKTLRRIVEREVKSGSPSFISVLRACEGAHPETVKTIIESVITALPPKHPARSSLDTNEPSGPKRPDYVSSLGHGFRSRASELYRNLPAPNPELAQWWFDVDSLEYLVTEVKRTLDGNATVLCLGAPTVAYALAIRGVRTILADSDPDVIKAVKKQLHGPETEFLEACEFNAGHDELTDLVTETAQALVLDPPWYRAWFSLFLASATPMLERAGNLFMTLLPRLTRPEAETDRADVVAAIQAAGFRVLAVERAKLGYVVPRFERTAYDTVAGFTGLPWRRGDLVHAVLHSDSAETSPFIQVDNSEPSAPKFETFARSEGRLRVFVRSNRNRPPGDAKPAPLCPDVGYRTTVSARGRKHGTPHIWCSEKTAHWSDADYTLETVRLALRSWAKGEPRESALDQVSTRGKKYSSVVDYLDQHLHLWGRFESVVKGDQEPTAGPFDPTPEREHSWPHDPYRGRYSRDRDRLVWSDSLRSLANKTQVFPASRDDQLRQRLTHSLEVVQLATTIGRALDLDVQLIEAGGLAHDIGHTPFGHAGEHALHYVMARIDSKLFFNHYEHGVDVVRYLEGPYQHYPGHPGLNLTRGTIDCIFKHIYWHAAEDGGCNPCAPSLVTPPEPTALGQKRLTVPRAPNSLEDLHARSKHSEYLTREYCHPEGQAVRLADKISYLLSDLEDGIRLGAISFEDIRSCSLFLRPPIDFTSRFGESLASVYKRERRNILKVLMEDAIDATSRLLYQKNLIQGDPSRVVDHSPGVASEVGEVWERLQRGKLHTFPAVRRSNLQAAKVVSELVVALTLMPEMIDVSFRESHDRVRSSSSGQSYFESYESLGKEIVIPEDLRSVIPLERTIGENIARVENGRVEMASLVLAKDYVASLSDSHATDLHAHILV